MLGKVETLFDDTSLNLDSIEELDSSYFNGVSSVLDLITLCDKNNDLIAYNSNNELYLAYIRDIRFDYTSNQIFIPVYIYDYFYDLTEVDLNKLDNSATQPRFGVNKVGYNQRLIKYVLFNKGTWLVDNVVILHSYFGLARKYDFNISSLPIRNDVTYDTASVLFNKYIISSYADRSISFYNYHSSRFSSLTNAEKSILKKHNLHWYSKEYCDIDYSDVRSYSYKDISSKFSDDILHTDISFSLRRIDFESYLMVHLLSKVYWYEFTKGSMERLIKGRDFFCKYSLNGVSLIVKKAWLKNY